jgi:ParB-like chromosome segregation protein Spo0J
MAEKNYKTENWPIGNITPYRQNVKKHEKEQVARIAASILKHGFDVPIVVDKHGVIIKGHGRRLALLELGRTHALVIVRDDLSDEQVRASRLADNRVALSDIDTDMLREELDDLDPNLLGGIFDTKELEYVTADLGEMNLDPFVSDMDEVVADQKKDMEERLEVARTARVPLARAFGFKDIAVAAQIHISRFMGKAEAATGLTGEEALISYMAAH